MGSEYAEIDLNADLGEGVTDDPALLAVVTSANVACGFHAGDARVMAEVCGRAAELGVVVGAQVSYADREGFGRRAMDPAAGVLTGWVCEQVEQLSEIATAAGTSVDYVKAHGALYNRIATDETQARAVLAGSGRLPVLGLPGSKILELAARDGRVAVGEGFPDRGYTAAGMLVPRSEPGALVEDPTQVAANAVALAARPDIRTVCVHGDSPGAVDTAGAVRAALTAARYDVRAWAGQA
ncbi:MAG: 5-oxoprolinase subunit PxpA [Marmoricola sp.]